jgi:integrase
MKYRIRVHVVHYKDCKNLVLRYKDPLTGKYERSTVYRDPQTGAETETGTNRKAAKKLAALWESDLNTGRDHGRHAATWEQFRVRYEDEVVPTLALGTGTKINTAFNAVEKHLPGVTGWRLADLDAERLSRLQTELRRVDLAESTIGGYLAHLHAALQWAADQGMIFHVPKMKRPRRAKKVRKTSPMKGRPITAEEFERMLAKVGEVVGNEAAPSWVRYLQGLWWSGLRLSESIDLYWDRADRFCVDLSGKRPMLRVLAEYEKGHQDRLLPISPEFAEFLLQTPENERRGRVFKLRYNNGPLTNPNRYNVGKVLGEIGRAAKIKVYTHPKTGKVKYASAHDLRRSFGERWSTRVMPQVLMALMRHETIETTMRYYVGRNANVTADAVWAAYESEKGTVLGTVAGKPLSRSKKAKT